MGRRLRAVCENASKRSLFYYGIAGRIPAGFVSDGMSVPRFLWSLLGAKTDFKTLRPGIAHDWLYSTHFIQLYDADEWYMQQLIDNGFGRIRALVAWV